MVQKFWRTMTWLVLLVLIFSFLSWLYLGVLHIGVTKPLNRSQLLFLPTSIPSVWSIVRPDTHISWSAPFIVLLLQVFLTGGFYGTLVRANTGQSSSIAHFLSDARRSFWRLLLWNALWLGIQILLLGVTGVFIQTTMSVALLLLLVRFLFFFGDIALVCERSIPAALKTASATLLAALVPMLPLGVAVAILTGICLSVSGLIPAFPLLLLTLVYCALMTWVLHMVVARYLYYSNWSARAGLEA